MNTTQDAIRKADVLMEALPYIQRFRNEIIVVKYGGSTMEDKNAGERILADIALMECVGLRPVVVHGGGKAITKALKDKGVEARFVKGLRVTCEQTIDVVQQVMNTDLNPGIVATLERLGARAQGIHGEDIIRVVKMQAPDAANGQSVDLGFVGDPFGIDTGPIRELLAREIIPVITPLGLGPDDKLYNINADVAAAEIARALKARKLAFLSDVPGLLANPADPESLITTLKVSEVEELMRRGVIDGGMLPKVQSGVEALRGGVKKVHMIDGRMPHSLLLEFLTDKGVGTEIIWDE
jgi:acetylglutamate kinase